MGTFEYFDHAADVGIQVEARSLPELFATAARALMEWIGPAPETPGTIVARVRLEAVLLDELMVRWLQELLYLFQQRRAYWIEVRHIDISEEWLDATVLGSAWDESAIAGFQEVKAVTYHRTLVERKGDGWRARVILDL